MTFTEKNVYICDEPIFEDLMMSKVTNACIIFGIRNSSSKSGIVFCSLFSMNAPFSMFKYSESIVMKEL